MGDPARARRPLFPVLALAALACGGFPSLETEAPPATTFERFYRQAEEGEAGSQNLIGFMLFFGEMAPSDRVLAYHWFRTAAAQGHVTALLNLSLLHYFGIGVPRDTTEAEQHFQRAATVNGGLDSMRLPSSLPALVTQTCTPPSGPPSVGEQTYTMFCAGCHGLNGIAAYVGSPSFALGERLEKGQDELFRTVVGGHEVMPDWSDKLPRGLLMEALRFVRTLPQEFRHGVLHPLRSTPEQYFLFGPMTVDSIAFQRDTILSSLDDQAFAGELCSRN